MRLSLLPLFAVFLATIITSWGVDVPLGIVVRGREVAVDIEFASAAPDSIPIGLLQSDCSCLQILSQPAEIIAGRSTIFPGTYRSEITGRVEVTISVPSVDGAVEVTSFRLRGFVADPSWWVSPNAVDDNMIIVDTRGGEAFKSIHIPRAINLQEFALRHRKELKDADLLVVDSGAVPQESLEQIQRLRAAGFHSVRALLGGVAGWARAGKALEGTSAALPLSAAGVSALDYLRSAEMVPWTVVKFDGAMDRAEMLQSEALRTLDQAMRGRSQLRGLSQPVLVCAQSDLVYSHVEAYCRERDYTDVFYLRGGRAALDELKQQERVVERGGAVYRTSAVVAGPGARGGSSNGCGTCPKR